MMSNRSRLVLIAAPLVAALSAVTVTLVVTAAEPDGVKPAVAAKPALTVTVTTPQPAILPIRISANGNIMAWQEANIGTEANGLRLSDVTANVGDVVRRGQVLATFAADTVSAELAQSRATVAEAEATFADAAVNAQRARDLQATGALSAQQINQFITAEHTAQARLEVAKAAAKTQQLRLAQTQVLAPDDGVISSRSATVGAVLPAGQELFRMIRRGRLEWRAEVAAADLTKLKLGQKANISPTGGEPVQGAVRMVAPSVDMLTRNSSMRSKSRAGCGCISRGRVGACATAS
jgi:HlyD family secretion protein